MKKGFSAFLLALLLVLTVQAAQAFSFPNIDIPNIEIPDFDFPTPTLKINPDLFPDFPLPSFFPFPEVTPEPEMTPEPEDDNTPQKTKKPSSKKVSDAEVTSFGLYFEEVRPKLTDEWYMFTPLDLSLDGVQVYPLVADNRHIIGEVRLSVSQGLLTVEYELADDVKVGREFFTLFPYLDAVQTVNVKLLNGQALPFEEPIDLTQRFGEDRKLILYLNNTADYDSREDGISEFSADAFRAWMQNMLPLMD